MEQTEITADAGKKELVVTIHDEDTGGAPYRVEGNPSTLVQVIIDQFYTELGTDQQEGDRLYCLKGGDVFAHATEHLNEYAHRECAALEWGYSRPTGGA
jgi:hypothetical protein